MIRQKKKKKKKTNMCVSGFTTTLIFRATLNILLHFYKKKKFLFPYLP